MGNSAIDPALPKQERVAVITVHGVADQAPNHTAEELARLLQADCANKYAHFEQTPLVLSVVAGGSHTAQAGPDRAGWFHSNFTAEQLAKRAADGAAAKAMGNVEAAVPYDIAYSENFFSDLVLPHREQTYTTTRLRSERRDAAANLTQTVDIYELYWADLSRLGSSLLRIGGEFYQLLFHLAYLAKTVVAHARNTRPATTHDAGSWKALHVAHGASEWLLTRPIALINLYQVAITLALAMLLMPEPVRDAWGILVAAGIGVLVVGVIHWKYGFFYAMAALSIGSSLALLLFREQVFAFLIHPGWVFGSVLLLGTLGYAYIIKSVEARVEGVGGFGYLWPALLFVLVLIFSNESRVSGREELLVFGVRAMEFSVYGVVLASAVLLVSNLALYFIGAYLGFRPGTRAALDRSTVATARLGTYLACMLFIVLTLTVWGVVIKSSNSLWPSIEYMPLFGHSNESMMMVNGFVERMMKITASSFGPLVTFLGAVVAFSLYAMSISLFREVVPKPGLLASEGVGRWLDNGLKLLAIFLSVMFFLFAIGGVFFQLHSIKSLLDPANAVEIYQTEHFDFVVSLLAGSAVTLIALGSRIGGFVRSLRSVLDVFLDVDNYFKDRPKSRTPRGRIYARYATLLEYVAKYRFDDGCHYDRIVVIAHSQGTVITADLFRALSQSGSMAHLFGERPLHLLTAGCPLRQLYASRFPDLYPWVVAPLSADNNVDASIAVTGPDPRSLSVVRWTNVYQSGDYVGRYLWTKPERDDHYTEPANAEDTAVIFAPQHATATIREMCVGSGAHIHYFDGSAPLVAGEVDRLISAA
jgi:hypothetical protein